MRAITYARVSTGKQAESGISLNDQAERMTAAVERRGWTLTAEYVDAGRSGRTDKARPELDAALAALAAGDADALVVAKLDRLARSTIALSRIMAASQAEGWSLVILDPELDTSTAAGRLTATVLMAVAEYESELISKRVTMTHKHRKAAGKRAGRAPELAETVRAEVAERRAAGETLAGIAADLNAREVTTARGGRWHASTVAHVARSVALDAELAEAAA